MKRSFNQEYQQVNFLQTSVIKSKRNMIFPDHKTSRRGITSAKKDGILECLLGVSDTERPFWENLCINETVRNLCFEREKEDEEPEKIPLKEG